MISEIFAGICIYTFGALIGVLWPAQSKAWKQVQVLGIVLLCATLLCFFGAFLTAQFSSQLMWWLLLVGTICFVGYFIVGNVCRMYHENANEERVRKRDGERVA